MNIPAACRCETFVHPRAVFNPPGLASLAYRVGDFLSYRHALLLSRPGELHLNLWRPDATADLGVQLVEWWAYLAEVLAFYNERTAAQAFLRTADDEEFVRNLTRILGYRPRPGFGAHGSIAALLSGKSAVSLPPRLQFQTKPGPGRQPQIFELDAEIIIAPPDDLAADPVPETKLLRDHTLLLAGTVKQIAPGDQLLLIHRDGSKSAWIEATAVAPEKDPHGRANTRLSFKFLAGTSVPETEAADNYKLQRSTQTARPRSADGSLTNSQVSLESLHRDLTPGMPIVIESRAAIHLAGITSIAEDSYSLNPTAPPNETKLPVPGTVAGFAPAIAVTLDSTKTTVRFGWRDAGTIIAAPTTALTAANPEVVVAADTAGFAKPRPILLQPAAGAGAAATAQQKSDHHLTLAGLPTGSSFAAPLHLLPNLLPVSRGKSVVKEVLGSGDATQAGQEFVLHNAPVTYFQDHAARSGDGYSSTIRLRVNDVEWREVPSFFGQPADARVFVTSEDAAGKTHVKTGDGLNGARLPSGVDNVVAGYRFGGGEEPAGAGELSVINKAWPGLRAIRNPLAIGGGADPDSPARLRDLAPRSVLTFGRAVSATDYEVIAAAAPGVKRVRAYWAFNAVEQRAMLILYVGDDDDARRAAESAVTGIGQRDDADVRLAHKVRLRVALRILVDRSYDRETVKSAVRTALVDPAAGLFGVTRGRIGRAVYRSAVHKACRDVAGVVSSEALTVSLVQAPAPADASTSAPIAFALFFEAVPLSIHRYDPGEGGFFTIENLDADLLIETELADGR